MKLFDPRLSRVRTVLFAGMTLVWFSEMLFHGIPALSRVWSYLWQVPLPPDTQLATALNITWATASPAKGALGVMAVYGLLSKNPSARTALFVSMALVPPLNIAFPFREQGFLLGPMTVATTLSAILWVSFFLFKEPARGSGQERAKGSRRAASRLDVLRYGWFAVYSMAVTVMAVLFLFWPRAAVDLTLPCLSGSLRPDSAGLQSLIDTTLASGTHLAAVATGCWIATVNCRSNPVLRRAMTAAGIAHAGLFAIFPLWQIALGFGGACATSSILVVFVPLFLGWLLYAGLSHTLEAKTAALLR